MISDGLEVKDAKLRLIRRSGFPIEPKELVTNTFKDLDLLLEDYAPAWYTEELHEKAEAALLVLDKVSGQSKGQ